MRDHKDNFSVKSILLTALLGNEVRDDDEINGGNDFSDLPTTLKVLSNRMNTFLQNHPTMPEVENPVLPEENFNRHWNQGKYENFREKFNSYNKRINEAHEEKDHNQSVKKWCKLFGDSFGELRPSSTASAVTGVAAGGVAMPAVPATKPYAHK